MSVFAALLRRGAAGAATLFGDRRCAGCAGVFTPGEGACIRKRDRVERLLCRTCLDALPRREKGICPRCGEPAAWPELPPALCGRCMAEAPPWQGFICHGAHEGLLRRLLIRLKFGGEVHLASALGPLLAAHPGLCRFAPGAVVPVPLHRDRLASRGFNQALELARPLARALHVPLAPGMLVRTRATPPQTGRSRAKRMRAMRDAFAGHESARGRRLLLVDDTLTTGATLAASARALLAAGAAGVDVAVVSRTPLYADRGRTRAPLYPALVHNTGR